MEHCYLVFHDLLGSNSLKITNYAGLQDQLFFIWVSCELRLILRDVILSSLILHANFKQNLVFIVCLHLSCEPPCNLLVERGRVVTIQKDLFSLRPPLDLLLRESEASVANEGLCALVCSLALNRVNHPL